MQRPWRN